MSFIDSFSDTNFHEKRRLRKVFGLDHDSEEGLILILVIFGCFIICIIICLVLITKNINPHTRYPNLESLSKSIDNNVIDKSKSNKKVDDKGKYGVIDDDVTSQSASVDV
mmetsp:Transcript_46946/g.57670  ORF Transcript_46946/g.57670 Transcript_46946/m.57670 type:complete len:110 (+) Transcript_46946:47-376(+)